MRIISWLCEFHGQYQHYQLLVKARLQSDLLCYGPGVGLKLATGNGQTC